MNIHWWMRKWRYGKVLKNVRKGAVVMDVGCGEEPLFLGLIEDEMEKGYGIDKRVDPGNGSRVYTRPKVELVNFDFDSESAVSFPLPNGRKMDQVFMLAVIEHVYHARPILSGIYDALIEGGDLILTTPTRVSRPVLEFLSYRLKLVSEEQIRDHKHYFSKDELIGILEETGFDDIRHSYFQCGMNQIVEARKPHPGKEMAIQ